jgi:hypothetical protein
MLAPAESAELSSSSRRVYRELMTTHSRNTAASMSVSRQNTSAMRACARRKDRTASCGMNATLLATTVARLWSMTLEVEALQVRNVAGNVEGNDLASTAGKDLVAAGEPFKDRAALRWPVLIAKDVLVRSEIADRDR